MSINDGWAKASIRLVGPSLSEGAIPPELAALAVVGPRTDVLAFLIADDTDSPLQQLLVQVQSFVNEHQQDFKTVRLNTGARLELFLGWSPSSPQDSLTFEPSLLALLAEYDAGIVIDTYSD